MFFLFALISVFAYSLQNALVAPLYRHIKDKLSVVFYRGAGISISFAPVLLFIPQEDFAKSIEHLPMIAFAAGIAVVGTWSAVNAVNSLAIGIANSLMTVFSNLCIIAISVWQLGETLTIPQMALMALIVAGVSCLGMMRTQGLRLASHHPIKGVLFCLIFAAFTGSSYVLLAVVSRQSNPLLIGYLWELFIGVGAGLMLLIRSGLQLLQKQSQSFTLVSRHTFLSMLMRSSPTGVGTACYALAMTYGSIAITATIMNLSMVITTVLAVILYGEHLSKAQWFLLSAICILVSVLRLVV